MRPSNRTSRPLLVIFLDSFIWYAFLGLLVLVSFLDHQFASSKWALLISAFLGLSALHCLSVAFGGRANLAALSSAKVACLLLFATILLLGLQLFLPYSTALHDAFILEPQKAPTLAWFTPSMVWSVVPNQTEWLFLKEIAMLTVFTTTLSLVSTRLRVKQLFVVILCVGLLHALVGSLAKFAGLSLVDLKQLDGHFSAARGWFVNRNHFASFVSLTMVGAMTFFLKDLLRDKPSNVVSMVFSQLLGSRAPLFAVLLISLVAIILSQSRAGFLGLMFVCWIPVFFLVEKGQRTGLWWKFVLPVTVIVIGTLWYFGGELIERLSGDAMSLGERILQWEVTWSAIKNEWLLGYGGNSYETVFQIEREYADLRQVVFDQSHNHYLHIWLEQGLLGLLFWLGLIGMTSIHALQAFKNSSSTLVAASMLAIIVVMTAALLQAGVDFNLQIPNIRYYFFVIIALTYSIPTIKQSTRTKRRFLLI